ncbi:unnamed protein product [Mucor hiemalis]
MRDMLSNDDEDDEDDNDGYHGESHHSTSYSTQQQRTPQLSSADFPPAISSSSKAKVIDDSALPAHASWAKLGSSTSSTPSTPVLAVSDAFGPTLSAAVAASQQKTQFPPMPKRKSEKKKRKEQLQQQKPTPEPTFLEPSPTPSKAESSKSEQTPSSPSTSTTTTSSAVVAAPTSQPQEPPQREITAAPSLFEQGLTGFVLGQAYKDLCPLPNEEERAGREQLEDELTLGVSALLLDDSEKPPPQPSPAQRHLEAIQSAAASSILVNVPNVLDFLTYSTPTPKYNGRFNPFAHMGAAPTAPAPATPNRVSNLDSPIRRHSRFGFAQA